MRKQTRLRTGAMAGAVCTVIAACSSSNSSTSGVGADPTPNGTMPVTSAPYPVCATLEKGSFTTNGSSYPVPATRSCAPQGTPTPGPADMHCVGVPAQPVHGADCSATEAASMAAPAPADDAGGDGGASDDGDAGGDGGASDDGDAGGDGEASDDGDAGGDGGASDDGGAQPSPPGPCDENGVDGAYGSTMYGTEGDDDDCKYHMTYTASPICENSGTYFVVTAVYKTGSMGPVTGASTFAELCLSDTHLVPQIDARPPYGNQQVVEGPPGTYTIGPVQFDAAGDWTVRFHFNEFCCDVTDDSPHGHAAFHVTVP